MSGARKGHVVKRGLALVVAAILCFIFLSGMERSQTPNSAGPVKLAGPLADLARTVPQERGAAAKLRQAPRNFNIESMPKSARDAVTTRMMRINSSGEVQVYVLVTEINDDNLKQLESAGVTLQLQDDKRRLVQALVPIERLAQVSELPFVQFVRLPTYARRRAGSVDTEGDAILHAIDARQQLGIDGTGVRVAALSDGLKGVFATGCTTCQGAAGGPISTGDLPNATGTRNSSGVLISSSGGITGTPFPAGSDLEGLPPAGCGFAGAGAEGTALLEIIHDIAPGAQLSFANFQTDVEFNAAVSAMAGANDVVVDDIGFFGGPYDGTSSVSTNTANALNSASNPIRAYVTSVGNDTDIHYLGLYTDSKTDGSWLNGLAGDLHLFQASSNPATVDTLGLGPQTYNEIELPAPTQTKLGGEVVVFLTWDDPFGSSTNNYDVYLVEHGTNTAVAGSLAGTSTSQGGCFGPGYPVDCFEYVNNTTQTFFDIVIQNRNNAATPRHLNLFAFSPECAQQSLVSLAPPSHAKLNFNTPGNSVSGQADAGGSPVSVISAGAICSGSAAALNKNPSSCNDPNHDQIEFFSSIGPTLDGRQKPDISAIDGVSITGAGNFENPFFGTSAAAPHVAGIAALLLQSKTCLLSGTTGALDSATARADLRDNLLLNPSVPLPDLASSPNNTFGWGRADALNSAYATLPTLTGATTLVVTGNTPNGASLTASQLGYSAPQTCPMATLNWTGGCGTGPATSMSCPFGTTAVSVSASNNAFDYPSTPTALTITVTDFSIAAAPPTMTVSAGNSAQYTVTVSSQYGPFPNAVALSCSNSPPLPAGTSCSFNPATVTPGAAGATSTLTISTTGAALAPPLNVAPPRHLMPPLPVAQPHRGVPVTLWLALAAFALLGLWATRLAPTAYRGLTAAGGASLAAAAIVIQIACGGSSAPPPPPPAPAVSLSPSSLTFSTQTVGKSSNPQPVTLTNSGNAPLSITSITASGDFSQTYTCSTSVLAGANCAINVTFTPTTAGSRTGAITITDNASGSPHTVSLTGTGQVPTPAGTYAIGINGTAGTLVNSGTATLVVQ
jgi:hypothetical protein